MTTEMTYLVSDAGFLATTRQLAVAVQPELRHYVTPLAISRSLLRGRVRRFAGSRALDPDLASRLHRTGTVLEGLRLLANHGSLGRLSTRCLLARNRRVDACSSRLVRSDDVVIGQTGVSVRTFTRARQVGAMTVLDYPIARRDLIRELLEDEMVRQPAYADSLQAAGAVQLSQNLLDQMREESHLADLIIVGSRFVAGSFAGTGQEHAVRVVPYGIPPSAFPPKQTYSEAGPGAGPLRLVFCGHLSQRKGLSYLIEAMRSLDPESATLTLAGRVIGSGRWMDDLPSNVTYAGMLSHGDLAGLFRLSDVFVLPSLAEGSAVVVLEAMSSGLPVIVTPNTGADQVHDGRNGFIVPIRSSEAIADRIGWFVDHRDAIEPMGRAAADAIPAAGWATFHAQVRSILGLPAVTTSPAA